MNAETPRAPAVDSSVRAKSSNVPACAPFERVCTRYLVGGLRDPERLRGDADAAAVERRHGDTETAVLFVQEPVALDVRALDHDVVGDRRVEAELLLVARDPHMIRIEDERAHAARPGGALVGARKGQERPRVTAVRDPLLRAGDRPAVTGGLGLRAQRARIRAGFGLGEREGAEMLPARERRDEARLLLVGPVDEEWQCDRARVHGDRHPHSGVGARQLFEHEDVGQEVHAGAAVLLRHARAHQAELRQLGEELAREVVVAVPLRRVRIDLRLREVPRQRLDLFLVLRELEVHFQTEGYVRRLRAPGGSS